MYLASLKLWNFRKFGCAGKIDITKPSLDLNFKEGFNVLIGENDAGKTAIIDAIKLVLRTHSYEYLRVSDEDFFSNSDRFRIEIILRGFTNNEAANFTEWLSWDGNGENAEVYLNLMYDVTRKDGRILPADVRAGSAEDGFLLTALAKDFLKATYLKPLRDAKAELIPKKNSRLSQIFQEHEAFKGKHENHHLLNLFNDFNKKIELYFDGRGLDNSELDDSLGKDLKEEIDSYLRSFHNDDKISDISVNEGTVKAILEKLELLIKDETNIGLGSLNRLFMASELLHLKKKNWDGLRLGLIEELEAHLHPQAQMQVVESLQKHSSVQLILSTHSPNLASKIKLENLIFCTNRNAFPLGREFTKLASTEYAFLERFLDATKSNLFFAKGVIMVEGWSEEILLPAIAKHMKRQGLLKKTLTESGVSIVNVGSTAFLNYSKIFMRKSGLAMDIPVSVISDLDVRPYTVKSKNEKGDLAYEKIDSKTLLADSHQQLIKILKKHIGENVLPFVSRDWTLEFCLLNSSSLQHIFKKVVMEIHSKTDWKDDFEMHLVKKLLSKNLKKVEIAYKMAALIEDDLNKPTPEITFQFSDPIYYLVDAISYASRNQN